MERRGDDVDAVGSLMRILWLVACFRNRLDWSQLGELGALLNRLDANMVRVWLIVLVFLSIVLRDGNPNSLFTIAMSLFFLALAWTLQVGHLTLLFGTPLCIYLYMRLIERIRDNPLFIRVRDGCRSVFSTINPPLESQLARARLEADITASQLAIARQETREAEQRTERLTSLCKKAEEDSSSLKKILDQIREERQRGTTRKPNTAMENMLVPDNQTPARHATRPDRAYNLQKRASMNDKSASSENSRERDNQTAHYPAQTYVSSLQHRLVMDNMQRQQPPQHRNLGPGLPESHQILPQNAPANNANLQVPPQVPNPQAIENPHQGPARRNNGALEDQVPVLEGQHAANHNEALENEELIRNPHNIHILAGGAGETHEEPLHVEVEPRIDAAEQQVDVVDEGLGGIHHPNNRSSSDANDK